MYNRVILVGNLTRDVEIRYLPSGQALGKTAIATSRKYKVNSEPKEEVCFIDLTFWGRSAEIANQYLKKGSKILIEGRLTFDQWSDSTGNKRSKHSVTVENLQMLDTRSSAPQNSSSYNNSNSDYDNSNSYNQRADDNYKNSKDSGTSYQSERVPEIDIDNDDIPF